MGNADPEKQKQNSERAYEARVGKADSGLQIQVGTGPKDREAETALIRRKISNVRDFPMTLRRVRASVTLARMFASSGKGISRADSILPELSSCRASSRD